MALKDKVVLITGGASGIGEAVTRRFIQEGAKVSIIGRSEEKLAKMQEEFGESILTYQGDVSKYEDNEQAVQATVKQFGKLDVFIANAGVFDGFAKFADVTPDALSEAYDFLLDINVKGSFLARKQRLKNCRKQMEILFFLFLVQVFILMAAVFGTQRASMLKSDSCANLHSNSHPTSG